MRHLFAPPGRTLLPTLILATALGLLVTPLALMRRQPSAPSAADTAGAARPATTEQSAREAFGRIPLSFEANRGQTDGSVDFFARGAGYALFLKPSEAVFALRSSDPDSQSKVLRMRLVGSDASAAAVGENELEGKANHLVGDDPSKWRTDVPTYARVSYREVYEGVDLVYYGNQRQLEYDFRVAPGADPRAVTLKFEGADKIDLDANGDLLLKLGEAVVRQPRPFVYQEVAGARREVEGGYDVGADGRVGFSLGEYDRAHTLVIDPVIVYSTYLGDSGTDTANDITVDAFGNAYLCGETTSTNFPTANALDATFAGGQFAGSRDAFVTKINATGSALVYSTYLGGSGDPVFTNINGDDRCFGIRVDGAGNAYLAGETHSNDFPTANAIQATFGGGLSDAFVAKLNPAGSALVYSTYLGGNIFDAAQGLALDSSNNVYVTGRTTSANYPTANAIQATQASADADAFVTKINAAGTALVYSTYLGGSTGVDGGFENGSNIAIDAAGNAYVTGQTRSTNFPTVNPIQATFGGGSPDGDAFATKINAAGTALVYSTYLGGSNNDIGSGIGVDASGNAVVAGFTSSNNFPTANALDATFGGSQDGFVTKLNPVGSAFVYSTYLGGTGGAACNDVKVDSAGNAYVAGGTTSTDFPTVNPTQAANAGGVDAFAAKLNPAGSALVYSTYLGGAGGERANAVAIDSAGSIYLAGPTDSANFPTVGAIQAANGGGTTDAFVTKIAETTTTFQFSQATYAVQEDVTFVTVTVTRTGDTSTAADVDYATADGSASERTDYTTALGTLRFAASETSKTFDVLVNEDSFAEGPETFTVRLSNPTGGASLGALGTATIAISDDAAEPTTNVIDDPVIFVGQHYHDFLNRQADTAGLNFWADQIIACGADAGCIDRTRTAVSQAFFLSIEYQNTGYFVFRFYRASFTDTPARPRGMPRYREFLRDQREVGRGVIVNAAGWETVLEANKEEFARRWVQRPEFLAEFPESMSFDDYVAKLAANSGVTLTPTEINILFEGWANTVEGRARTLRRVIELGSVYNAQFNTGFVLSQYIGYLRRNPNDAPEPGLDYAGFDFWLAKLNSFSQSGEDVRDPVTAQQRVQRAEMVRAFILSIEYRQRFGP
ncbi:MAG TPA: SBBP repeat-containing protein [Pyrinomonadaceae bacterium]|nr:SBBP repeat-containing protein [Pyrinomonadaceae bacterium]